MGSPGMLEFDMLNAIFSVALIESRFLCNMLIINAKS